MSITTLTTANNILNRVAAEVGLAPVVDPYSSSDPAFIQMQYLLNTAGEELLQSYPWELLNRETSITTTVPPDTGDYPLPDDFAYMINQTGWERSQNIPLFGPLSAQDWQYLLGRDLVNNTIYASFRISEGMFKIFPQPPPNNLDIHYEYISKNWVSDGASPLPAYSDEVQTGSDIPLYDKTLVSRYLKVKFLEAKGYDTTKAQDDFNQTFSFLTGLEKGAEILYAGNNRGFPYLNIWRNLPDTGYGSA
jgi:hypothetical protein